MDLTGIKRILRFFWMSYAVGMMVLPLVLIFLQGSMALFIVSAVGAVLFWALRDVAHEPKAVMVLQGFFVFVIADCTAALFMGDIIPAALSLSLIALSLLSFYVWRKETPSRQEAPPPQE